MRAMAIYTGLGYNECHKRLLRAQRKAGGKYTTKNGVLRIVWTKVFKKSGLKRVAFPLGPKPTFTEAHNQLGDCIVKTRKHICAIVDGIVRDRWDCRLYTWAMVLCYECAQRRGIELGEGHDTSKRMECDDCGAYSWEYYNVVRERKATSAWVIK